MFFSFVQWNKYKMKCSIQLGFASLNGTFHLSPHENICTIALINIHYLYNISPKWMQVGHMWHDQGEWVAGFFFQGVPHQKFCQSPPCDTCPHFWTKACPPQMGTKKSESPPIKNFEKKTPSLMLRILISSYRLKEVTNFYVLHCFLMSKNCTYPHNQMFDWDGVCIKM